MLKFCLVVDTEKFISFKQGNPRWKFKDKLKGRINNLIKNFRYNKNGFNVVYDSIVLNDFPTTFMLVGEMFSPVKSPDFVEWGYHTLNHVPLTLVKDEVVKRQVENKFRAKSFCAPLWMVEDHKNPDRIFKILESEKYSNVIYKGVDYGLNHEHHYEISKPKKRGKLKLIHVSNTFEGNSSKEYMNSLVRDIIDNLNKEGVYCLCTHDFTHKNDRNLLKIINVLKDMQRKNKIEIVNVKDA